VSYFESVQNDANYYWEHDAVLRRLDQKMTTAFAHVLKMAQGHDVYMRDAAYMVAIDKVVKSMELRGWL
jgi:glutamate dehydrogenase